MNSISVIIPAMNEEDNIIPVYNEVSSVLKKLKMSYEIIFVNDGSTDKTLTSMLFVQKKNNRVKVIDFYKNFGQTAAMQAGIDYSTKELICYIDGDLQIDFSELPLFLKEIDNGSDAVIGWRHKRKDSFMKTFTSIFARKLRKTFLGTDLHDYGCPFKVFKSQAIKSVRLYGEMHRYIPPLLRWKGYSTREVKITHKPRKFGKTKYNLTRIYRGFIDMINIWFWQKYSSRPLHIFGGIGILSIIGGVILGTILIVLRLLGKISLVNSSIPQLAIMMFLFGVIFFCFGLVSDMLMKIYYSIDHKPNYTIKKIYK